MAVAEVPGGRKNAVGDALELLARTTIEEKLVEVKNQKQSKFLQKQEKKIQRELMQCLRVWTDDVYQVRHEMNRIGEDVKVYLLNPQAGSIDFDNFGSKQEIENKPNTPSYTPCYLDKRNRFRSRLKSNPETESPFLVQSREALRRRVEERVKEARRRREIMIAEGGFEEPPEETIEDVEEEEQVEEVEQPEEDTEQPVYNPFKPPLLTSIVSISLARLREMDDKKQASEENPEEEKTEEPKENGRTEEEREEHPVLEVVPEESERAESAMTVKSLTSSRRRTPTSPNLEKYRRNREKRSASREKSAKSRNVRFKDNFVQMEDPAQRDGDREKEQKSLKTSTKKLKDEVPSTKPTGDSDSNSAFNRIFARAREMKTPSPSPSPKAPQIASAPTLSAAKISLINQASFEAAPERRGSVAASRGTASRRTSSTSSVGVVKEKADAATVVVGAVGTNKAASGFRVTTATGAGSFVAASGGVAGKRAAPPNSAPPTMGGRRENGGRGNDRMNVQRIANVVDMNLKIKLFCNKVDRFTGKIPEPMLTELQEKPNRGFRGANGASLDKAESATSLNPKSASTFLSAFSKKSTEQVNGSNSNVANDDGANPATNAKNGKTGSNLTINRSSTESITKNKDFDAASKWKQTKKQVLTSPTPQQKANVDDGSVNPTSLTAKKAKERELNLEKALLAQARRRERQAEVNSAQSRGRGPPNNAAQRAERKTASGKFQVVFSQMMEERVRERKARLAELKRVLEEQDFL